MTIDDEVLDDDVDPVLYTDRTTASTDQKCGMRRWWYKHEGGHGIVPVEEASALTVGKDTHEDMHVLAELEDISPGNIDSLVRGILSSQAPEPSQTTLETLYRRLGWFAASALFLEPRVRKTFKTIQTEAEIILDRSPLWVGVTPDRVLEHLEGHHLVYRELKSTITAGPKWISSWPFAIQLHLGIAAVQEELSRKVAYAQIVGLMKGETRDGRLRHPYVWGYYNATTKDWTHDYDKARASTWEPMPVWEYPGGLVDWVTRCGQEVGLAQFPHSAPVFLNQRLLDSWVLARTARELEVEAIVDDCRTDLTTRTIYFEPCYDQCRPPFGDPCPYIQCCHNAAVGENPLASRDFVQRIPHHEIELTLRKGAK
jgi:hypothetical protein